MSEFLRIPESLRGGRSVTEYTLDSLGNRVAVTNPLGKTTHFERDAWFRVTASIDPEANTTSTQFDVFGNVTQVTDPLGNVTQFAYNDLNWLVTEGKVYSGGTANRSFSYDGVGNRRSLTDRNGRLTEWDYDNRYRVTTETWKQGGSTVRTLDFTYDTVDRLTAVDDSDSLATDFQFAYFQRGQLVAERQLNGLIGTSVVFTRQYDSRGNRSELAANFGGTLSGGSVSGGIGDFVNQYVYDEGNRLGSVTQTEQSGGHAVAPKHATLEYNRASQLTDLRRYSADWASWSDLEVHSRREYDGAGRLVSITHGNQEISGSQTWDGTSTPPSSLGVSGMLAAYRMDYDENHRLASLASYADGFETSFGYDDRDQLTSAASAAISGLSQPYGIPSSESYAFDENGNRKSSGGQSQSDPDTHNQLQSDGTFNYTYDDEGNTLTRTSIASGEVTEYEWDHRNRLVSITERTSSTGSITQEIEYIYDAFDQRIGKRLDSDGNGTWDRDEAFVWTQGQTHLRLTDADGEGATETFHVASRYLYGDIVDHLLADEQYTDGAGPPVDATTASTTAGETLWALVDHLGSVRDLVANGGVVREHVVYDSFGNRLVEQDYDSSGNAISSSHAEAVDSLFGYTGRDWDTDAGLQYNRARWYDPGTGRWLSQDPIGFSAGDANLYRYVGNAATTKVDPTGLDDEEPWMTTVEGYGGQHYEVRNNWFAQGVGYVGAYVFWPLTNSGPKVGAPPPATSFAGSQARQRTHCNNVLEGNNFEGRICPSQPVPPSDQMAIRLLAQGNFQIMAAVPGMVFSIGSSSVIVRGGGLAAHEARGGHLIAQHIGRTEAQLSARLASQSRIPAASTFLTRTEAEIAMSHVLNTRSSDVASWVASGAKGKLALTEPYACGAVLTRGASSPIQGSKVTLVLKGDGDGGWYILTGYPGL